MLQSSWFQARLLSSLPRLLLTSLHRAFKADVLLTEGFKHKAKARCQVVQDARALSQSDNKIHLASFLFLKKWWMMVVLSFYDWKNVNKSDIKIHLLPSPLSQIPPFCTLPSPSARGRVSRFLLGYGSRQTMRCVMVLKQMVFLKTTAASLPVSPCRTS